MKFKEKLALAYVELIKLLRIITINSLSKLLFKKTKSHKKILVNRDGAFGDSIVALPALNLIRQNYPDAQIDLLSVNNNGISFKDLGLNKGLINNLYNIHKKERAKTLKTLREQRYDLFIQIPQNIGLYKTVRNMLLVRFYLKINYAYGWDYGRIKSFMRSQKNHLEIPTETTRFLETLNRNGLYGETNYSLVSKRPDDPKINNIIDNETPIAFLIGGKLQPKKWPLNHWVSLAKLIGDDEKILVIGGENEKEDGDYISSNCTNATNVCGQLSIPELHYLFEKTKVAISLDTGAMHLCDQAKTKLIVLFSTRDLSNKWFPNNENAIVLEKVLSCSFCLKTQCEDNICMKNILPNEVYSNMKALLEN